MLCFVMLLIINDLYRNQGSIQQTESDGLPNTVYGQRKCYEVASGDVNKSARATLEDT